MNARIWYREVTTIAKKEGAEVEHTKGGHLKIVHPTGWRVVTASTPGDTRRAAKNVKRDIRRARRAGGQLVDMAPAPYQRPTVQEKPMRIVVQPPPLPEPEPPPPPPETDREKLIRWGKVARARREAIGLSAVKMAAEIGMSASYLCMIEQGKTGATDAVLTAIEQRVGMARGSMPRLSTKNNFRIGRFAAAAAAAEAPPVEVAEVEPPVEVPQLEPPPVSEIRTPPAPELAPPPVDPFVRLHLDILAVQARMRDLGIARIEVTPSALSVTQTVADPWSKDAEL